MKYKYGEFSKDQISQAKELIRKRIFFLILIVDPETADKYNGVNVQEAFEGTMGELGGFNDLLGCPVELVTTLSLLNAARLEYESENFRWKKYRKYILDAGNEVMKMKEV